MDCKHVDALLMDYLYQELDPTRAEHVEAHLQVCARCAGEISAFERTRAAARELPQLEPPAALDQALLVEAARAVRLQPEPAPGIWQRFRESLRLLVLNPAMTAAVTLIVVLGVSFVIYRQGPPSTRPMDDPPPALQPAAVGAAPEAKPGEVVAFSDEQKLQQQRPAAARPKVTGGYRGPRPAAGLSGERDTAREDLRGKAWVDSDGWGVKEGRAGTRRASRPRQEQAALPEPAVARGDLDGKNDDEAPARAAGAGRAPQRSKKMVIARSAAAADQPAPVTPARPAKLEPKVAPLAEAAPQALPTEKAPVPPPTGATAAKPRPQTYGKGGAFKKMPSPGKSTGLDSLVTGNQGSELAKGPSTGSQMGGAGLSSSGGKAKLGQVLGDKQTAASNQDRSGAGNLVQLGMAAQKAGNCGQALAYYDRALAGDPKLAGKLSGLVRTCAVQLNEKALTAARANNRNLSGLLYTEVARRARARNLRQAEIESKNAVKARAKPAQKPAATEVDKAAY